MIELPKDYKASESEPKWIKFWEENKIYHFDQNSKAEIFSVDTPPPTVSGKMHIGHSFSYAQQDFVVRFQRMRGKNIFYPFGTDDNGLATIRLIEKEKKVNSFDMGREKFVKLVLDTLEKELRPQYLADWKRLGMSCEWDIFYTTIDKHCQKISQKSFIDLYKKGLEYRKRTPFMWCPECRTAIAQMELKDKETESKFVYMKFDTTINEQIVIATTRPELLPACVSVHVHPDDKRYQKFIGKKAIIPFFNRQVDIMPNKDVDMEFGSGIVYHCTFGDMDDVEWIEKFNIQPIEIMNPEGTLNEKAGKYKGLSSKQARASIIKDLESEGRVEKIEPIKHIVQTHERCDTEIEILMTDQWFIKYLNLKDDMLKWGSQLKWYPEHMKNRYDNWVKGLKYDWCISRQRFFGVPIPVWYCKKCNEILLPDEDQLPVDPTEDKPKVKSCTKCSSKEFVGEKDVLDTWATSSLTPRLAIELMPEKIQKKLYPMSLRPQAHDIITFWLFNTVVKSQLHYNKNPWKEVMISGWALDPKGKKMSKSKGNVIEPQTVINKYSADILRFWAAGAKLGEDLAFQEKDIQTANKTVIKLWNASKFAFMHLQDYKGLQMSQKSPSDFSGHLKDYKKEKPKMLEGIDRWLLSKLNTLIKDSTENFEKYEYAKVKADVEYFFWHSLCDNYLEIVKDRLYNPDKRGKEQRQSAQYALYTALLSIIKMFAPTMPFITEELYQAFFKEHEKDKSVHISKWPDYHKDFDDKKIEKAGDIAVSIVTAVRQEKTNNKKSLKEPVKTIVIETKEKIDEFLDDIKAATNSEKITFGKGSKKISDDLSLTIEL